MTRAVPNQFASLLNPTLPNLDADFAAVAPATVLPCTATGTNSITLTPVAATLTVSAYTDKDRYSFNAPATTTGSVTLQVQALGALGVYFNDGVTQLGSGDLTAAQYCDVAYQASLNSGGGGFVLVNGAGVASAGSWTPALAGSVVGGTQTYTTQVGRYIRNGNLVNIWASLQLSAKDATTQGNTVINGLPFTSTNVSNFFQAVAIGALGGFTATPSTNVFTAFVNPNTQVIAIDQSPLNGGALAVTPTSLWSASTQIILSGAYRIN